ncbi:MAG: hypothetical protein ABEH43_05620 [Flavobacteriales bacterium]
MKTKILLITSIVMFMMQCQNGPDKKEAPSKVVQKDKKQPKDKFKNDYLIENRSNRSKKDKRY